MLLIPVDHHERVEDLPAYIDAVASLHDMSDFLCESLPFPNPVDAIRLALSFSLTCCVIYVNLSCTEFKLAEVLDLNMSGRSELCNAVYQTNY
jgi:hypothetical protein